MNPWLIVGAVITAVVIAKRTFSSDDSGKDDHEQGEASAEASKLALREGAERQAKPNAKPNAVPLPRNMGRMGGRREERRAKSNRPTFLEESEKRGDAFRRRVVTRFGGKRGKHSRRPFCRSHNKALYENEEEAKAQARRAEKKLWAYECGALVGWHLTSRCPDCKCREVFHNEEQAKAAQARQFLESKSSNAPAKIGPCPHDKCGYTILSRWR